MPRETLIPRSCESGLDGLSSWSRTVTLFHTVDSEALCVQLRSSDWMLPLASPTACAVQKCASWVHVPPKHSSVQLYTGGGEHGAPYSSRMLGARHSAAHVALQLRVQLKSAPAPTRPRSSTSPIEPYPSTHVPTSTSPPSTHTPSSHRPSWMPPPTVNSGGMYPSRGSTQLQLPWQRSRQLTAASADASSRGTHSSTYQSSMSSCSVRSDAASAAWQRPPQPPTHSRYATSSVSHCGASGSTRKAVVSRMPRGTEQRDAAAWHPS